MQPFINYSEVSPREFALDVCAGLRIELGVDLVPILTATSLSGPARRKAACLALAEAIIDRAHRQGYQDFLDDPTDPVENPETAGLLGLGQPADEIDTEPNFVVSQHNARILAGYQGSTLRDYVFTLTKRFENMANASSIGVLVAEMASAAVISVSVPAAVATVKALRAKQTLLAAMRTGITSIGMKTAIAAVAAVLVALLLYLLFENPKKILGFVFNDTDDNFVVDKWRYAEGDLHMEHGEMVTFMEDHSTGDLDSPKIQLKARDFYGDGDGDNVVYAGVYFADRNIGFRGAEGVMVFSSTSSNLMFAHQFAVPYTNDNGTNIRLLNGGRPADLSKLYRAMYDARRVRYDYTESGYRLTSTVDDARGGVVACITSIGVAAGTE